MKYITLGIMILILLGCSKEQSMDYHAFFQQDTLIFDGIAFIPPFKYVESGFFFDGGTKYVKLKDSKGKLFNFCKDKCITSYYKGKIWLHTTAPGDPGSRLINDLETEKLIINILKSAIYNELSHGDIEAVKNCLQNNLKCDSTKTDFLIPISFFVEENEDVYNNSKKMEKDSGK